MHEEYGNNMKAMEKVAYGFGGSIPGSIGEFPEGFKTVFQRHPLKVKQ